jgi:hypothetical protein
LKVKKGLHLGIYFEKRQRRSGTGFPNTRINHIQTLVLDGLNISRIDTISNSIYNTAKLDQFRILQKKRYRLYKQLLENILRRIFTI